ncbi:G-type lectin S-receptor-like serine/threonine-protein kinase At4g03230 isoform X2 [Malania oleifera]|nr:G-type lectin S-receptor-like serine/threonine-protein kinase At4g03230 isoform X2 [Malania oleifera]
MTMVEQLTLVSWKSESNPGTGIYSFQQDPESKHYMISKDSISFWKSGGGFNKNDEVLDVMLDLQSSNKSISGVRLVMDSSGKLQYLTRNPDERPVIWSEPRDPCSVLKPCGKFGICNASNEFMCNCSLGFKPAQPETWNSGDFTDGCTRNLELCLENGKANKYEFFSLTIIKYRNPENGIRVSSENKCKEECQDCNCIAYSYDGDYFAPQENTGDDWNCQIWNPNQDLRFVVPGPLDGKTIQLFLKIAVDSHDRETSGSQGKRTSFPRTVVISCTILLAALVALACTIVYMSYLRRRSEMTAIHETRGRVLGNPARFYDSERHVRGLIDLSQFREDEKNDIDVPFFDFESILHATDYFSNENKLGQGGFGPVYKGKFLGGQEIAVKRLSSASGQGLEEFKNEVMLIAKLQHRNLVKLLGYCIKGDEKILLYEYMPNKSLDNFIFDRTLCLTLKWEKRFDIILGIARGLLYLHQDSRLRIIHRDLKTSNILLDEEMNPKISDFGLARIFGGKQTEAATNKVVGTYGYMAPEYALDGFFSIKSDVFSFGVVLLEIISGKKNTRFCLSEQTLSLLGYAWRIWIEERALDLVDHTLRKSCNIGEVLKCINVGLLCVQEDPSDRPTMSAVVVMLGGETITLPSPKQPAFVLMRDFSSVDSSSSKPEQSSKSSNMELTITREEDR